MNIKFIILKMITMINIMLLNAICSNSTISDSKYESEISFFNKKVKPAKAYVYEKDENIEPTLYLIDLMKNMSHQEKSKKMSNNCLLKTIEMSIDLPNCGRILFNATLCSGFCESSEVYVPNLDLKKKTCATCKITKFGYSEVKTKCSNNSIKTFKFKTAKQCSCVKLFI
jgi:hypothetical protein